MRAMFGLPRQRSLAAALLALASLLASCRGDESYPHRPIFLICPWSAGGGTDAVSRQFAIYLEHELGVPVSVINATGGAGVTGHSRVARARPDGYSLLMMTVEINMLHWRGLTDLTWESYTPLYLVNKDAAAVFVRADSPWKDLSSLLAAAKEEPGRLKASGTSTGGIWHLALAGWLSSEGLAPDAIAWVPYGGAGPSLSELASSGLDVVCCSVPEAATLLHEGTVRCLGVMSDQPVKGWEKLPTFASLDLSWRMGGWRGLAAPKGLPESVRDSLVPAIERIVSGESTAQGKTFPAFMDQRGFDASWERPAEFSKTLATFDRELGKLLTSPEFQAMNDEKIPAMGFPSIIGAGLAVCLGAYLVASIVTRRRRATKSSRRPPVEPGRWLMAAELVGSVVIYVLIADHLGFVVTAGALLLVLLIRCGSSPLRSGLVTVVLVPCIYQVFAVLLRVPLPAGLLSW